MIILDAVIPEVETRHDAVVLQSGREPLCTLIPDAVVLLFYFIVVEARHGAVVLQSGREPLCTLGHLHGRRLLANFGELLPRLAHPTPPHPIHQR